MRKGPPKGQAVALNVKRWTPFWNSYIWLRIRIGRWFYRQPQSTVFPYGDRIVRIGPRSIIKRGTILEVETMMFLSANTSLPIPRVWNVWTDRGGSASGKCWFIMEYVLGETWGVSWPRMSSIDREEVTVQMKGYVDELRGLYEGQYIGAVGFQPWWDFRISISERFKPFPDIESFYRHILWKVKMIAGESKAASLLERLESLKSAHLPSVVFTHCDLAPRNIILCNNRVSGIIDWEQSGWRPYWWEYVKSLYAIQLEGNERAEWIRFAESVLDVYDEEKVIDEEIRDIEGFPY